MIARGRATNLRLSIAVLMICFVAGIVISKPFFASWRDSLGGKPLLETPFVSPTLAHRTYLVLGLDDFTAQQPQVEAAWLAIVPSDYSAVELVGLPPAPLRDQYSPALGGVPLLSIQPYARGSLVGVVILDRSDLIELADRLGGVSLMGNHVDGAGLLAYVGAADPNQPDDLLIRQSAVIQSLVAQGALAGVKIDLAGLIESPSYRSFEDDELYEIIRHYYPLTTEAVRIRPLIGDAP